MDKGKKTRVGTIRDQRNPKRADAMDTLATTLWPIDSRDPKHVAPITPVDGYTRDRRALAVSRETPRRTNNVTAEQCLAIAIIVSIATILMWYGLVGA